MVSTYLHIIHTYLYTHVMLTHVNQVIIGRQLGTKCPKIRPFGPFLADFVDFPDFWLWVTNFLGGGAPPPIPREGGELLTY